MANKPNRPPTIRDRLDDLRRMFPKRDGAQMYARAADLRTPTNRATLYCFLESEEGTHTVHETLFNKLKPMTPAEWREWITAKAITGTGHHSEGTAAERMGIIKGSVIPGVNRRTGMFWRLKAVIGYVLHDIYGVDNPAMGARGNKAESSRLADGQANIRRRHRNRKRKTE